MSQAPTNPPGSPPRNPQGSLSPGLSAGAGPGAPVAMTDDYADFDGDPTAINQIPREPTPAGPRPSGNLHPPPGQSPGQFASASPSLTHIGVGQPLHPQHAAPQHPAPQYGSNPVLAAPVMQATQMVAGMSGGMTMTAMPGPPVSQVS